MPVGPAPFASRQLLSCTYQSPVGEFTLCADAGADPDGGTLRGLWMQGQKYFGAGLPAPMTSVATCDNAVLSQATAWLDAYFGGERPSPRDLPLDPTGTPFRRLVWGILQEIPYGQTITYGEVARQVARTQGRATMASLAVGGAVGHNPLSVIVPCHRVVGADGSLTGYAGGLDRKLWLLGHEGVDTSRLYRPARGTAL